MPKVTRVYVGGWSTPRVVIEDGPDVTFQVAGKCRLSCSACPSRIHQVSARLAELGSKVSYSWSSKDPREDCLLTLRGVSWKTDEVLPKLSETLGLSISAA